MTLHPDPGKHQAQAFVADQRVGVFVDAHHLSAAAKRHRLGKLDYSRLLKELLGPRHLVRAAAFVLQGPGVNQDCLVEALAEAGFAVRLKELKRGPFAAETLHGSYAVMLSLDALLTAPRLDTVILVSGDGDYVPLVKALKNHGCRVEVAGFPTATEKELALAADFFVPVTESYLVKDAEMERDPPHAGTFGRRTPKVHGRIVYEGLPRDEDLEAEERAAAGA